MRYLTTYIDDEVNFKFGNTGSILKLKAIDNHKVSSFTKEQELKIRVKNETAYLKTISVSGNGREVLLPTSDLASLPVGQYDLELWVTTDTGQVIYPDVGFLKLNINGNATQLTGDLFSSLTLADIENEIERMLEKVDEEIREKLDNILVDREKAPKITISSEDTLVIDGIDTGFSLRGERGKDGHDGQNGSNGKSAYEIAIDNGFGGSEEDWIQSLKGKDGEQGVQGEPGKDGHDGLNGEPGNDGLSAYEVAKKNGFVGNEKEWLESLKGKDGQDASVDLTGYLTKENAESKYAKKNELPQVALDVNQRLLTIDGREIVIPDSVDLTEYAKKSKIPSIIYDKDTDTLTINDTTIPLPSEVDLSPYYTRKQIDEKFDAIRSEEKLDLTPFETKENAERIYATKEEVSEIQLIRGRDGENGRSAYEIWKENGNQGTEVDFLNSLRGERGVDGIPGKDGITPIIGENGNWVVENRDTGVQAGCTDIKKNISSGNFDDIKKSGEYDIRGQLSNAPEKMNNHWSTLVVKNYNQRFIIQTLVSDTDFNKWERYYSNDVWGEWRWIEVSKNWNHDSAEFKSLLTDKSHYKPYDNCVFNVVTQADSGVIEIEYWKREELVTVQHVEYSQHIVSWDWQLPGEDKQSYIAKITNFVGNKQKTNYYAINVSYDVDDLPIMGFISTFANDDPIQRKEVLDYLTRIHVNYVQYYDWMSRHSTPLPTINGSASPDATFVPNTWSDIGNRLVRKRVIEEYIDDAKKRGMRNMAYMAINGSDTTEEVHGLKDSMWLYNDDTHDKNNIYKTLDANNGWGKYSLYNANWMNELWQQYMYDQMLITICNLPFQGWHIDMLGDPGDKYDSNGNLLPSTLLENGITHFINKQSGLGIPLGLNSVAEYGLKEMTESPHLNYLYTEVWNRPSYNDLRELIIKLTTSRDSNNKKKGVIIAGYMDYEYSKSHAGSYFNDCGVIMTDLVVMALGAAHLEMGEHMLSNEYFPNSNLNMSDNLKKWIVKINDFSVAYKTILSQGYQCAGLVTIDGGSVDSLMVGKVNAITKRNDDDVLGISLINMVGLKHDNWKDTNADQTPPIAQENVRVKINLGVENHDWYYADLDNPVPKKIELNNAGEMSISHLKDYGFILGIKKE